MHATQPDFARSHALSVIGRTVERSPRATMLLDHEWRVMLANRTARALDGLSPQGLLTAATASDTGMVTRALSQALSTSQAVPIRLRFGTADLHFLAWRVDPLPDDRHGMVMLAAEPAYSVVERLNRLAVANERAEERLAMAMDERNRLRRAARRLDMIASTDMLTGLSNAHAFRLRCAAALSRGPVAGSLIFVDLNGFKPVNDRFGHQAGDHVLKHVARVLLDNVRDGDLVGRLGGDEFAVWMDGVGPSALPDRLDALRRALDGPIHWEAPEGLSVILPFSGAALGAASYPDDGTSFDALLRRADARMYGDKPAQSREVGRAQA